MSGTHHDTKLTVSDDEQKDPSETIYFLLQVATTMELENTDTVCMIFLLFVL